MLWRLETLVIIIFPKFSSCLTQEASLKQESSCSKAFTCTVRAISRKLWHVSQIQRHIWNPYDQGIKMAYVGVSSCEFSCRYDVIHLQSASDQAKFANVSGHRLTNTPFRIDQRMSF